MCKINNERGSVTIYLLISTATLLFFWLLLYEILQIKITKTEVEMLTRQVARSVLSQFKNELLEYGLFGATLSENRTDSVVQNISKSQFNKQMSNLSTKQNIQLQGLYHLGDHRIFHRQILERMKYIAAIEFTKEVTQKMGRSRLQFAQASEVVKHSKKINDLNRMRNTQCDQAWMTAKDIADHIMHNVPQHTLQSRFQDFISQLNEAYQTNISLQNELNEPLQTINSSISIYPASYFQLFTSELGAIVSMYESLRTMPKDHLIKFEQLKQRMMARTNEWLSKRQTIEYQRKREFEEQISKQNDQKRAAEQELSKHRDGLNDACNETDIDAYSQLENKEGYFQKYKIINKHTTGMGLKQNYDLKANETFMYETIQQVDQLMKIITILRDEIYINEFALTHFTYRTQNHTTTPASFSNHRLHNQEVEYILYGFPSCRMNLNAAHTEMFALRIGLRTLENIVQQKTSTIAATPLVSMLSAFTEAIREANNDLKIMLNGGSTDVPFSNGLKMNYKDHLRLFYLLHSDESTTLSRIQSLIELNTGLDLTKHWSTVKAKAFPTIQSRFFSSIRYPIEMVISY
jgi:hypothetical protein